MTVPTDRWYAHGRQQGAGFMVVACDTFDGGYFPVYTDDPASKVSELREGLNQVMEVYNLSKPLDGQDTRAALFGQAAWDFGEVPA